MPQMHPLGRRQMRFLMCIFWGGKRKINIFEVPFCDPPFERQVWIWPRVPKDHCKGSWERVCKVDSGCRCTVCLLTTPNLSRSGWQNLIRSHSPFLPGDKPSYSCFFFPSKNTKSFFRRDKVSQRRVLNITTSFFSLEKTSSS